MEMTRLDARLSVSPQIRPDELEEVQRQGFRMVINNRPDGEEAGQPTSAELRAAANRLGLGYRHIPVAPGAFTAQEASAFSTALREAGGPVLAFCRTGTRSTTLWQAIQEPSRGGDSQAG
jgi:sulfide:quinone oxidoreductase